MAKNIVPFDYNEIYQSIAQKFIDRGYDVPYEGSNTAILTSILAYTIQSLNFNTAMNINEVLLTKNKKRKSAIQNARILSYEPKHRISNQLRINVKPRKTGSLSIPKYQEFKFNGYSYFYFGEPINRHITEDTIDDTVELIVKQGTFLNHLDYPDILTYSLNEEAQYIDIPFNDVEDDGLIVTVDTYDDIGNKKTGIKYTKKGFNLQDISDNTENQYYRKDDLNTENCRIYFRLGGLGKVLKEGSIIYVDVLRSDGTTPNSETFEGSIVGNLNASAQLVLSGDKKPQNYIYGQDEETIESIQQNAPMFYNTAGRCITEYDYKTFLKFQNSVLDGYAWGGESELIPQVGRVYYCCIPNLAEPNFNVQTAQIARVKVGENPVLGGEGNAIKDPTTGEIITTPVYENQISYVDSNADSGIFRKMNYKNNLYLSDGDIVSIIDTIKQYSTPGLQNYIKNPLYIFVDINVDIKKYEYGVAKGDVHKKIFDAIKSYFDKRKGLDANYVESALIKEVSSIVGSENGFTLDTLFSGYISDKNKVQMVAQDFDYNSSIITYSGVFDGNILTITSYLNSKCAIGDTITYTVSDDASDGLLTSKTFSVVLTASNINQGEIKSQIRALQELNLNVVWKSSNGSSEVKANEVPISFKNIYYFTEIKGDVYTVSALLNPSIKVNTQYDVFLSTDGILDKIYTGSVTQSDIANNEVSYVHVHRNPAIKSPGSIYIKIANPSNEGEYFDSIKCNSKSEAQKLLENDESIIYDSLAGKTAFFVTNTKQNDTNSYLVIMYLPDYMEVGDSIEIDYGTTNAIYKLTAKDIENRKVSYLFELPELSLIGASYNSTTGTVMTMLEYGEYSQDRLIPDSDDRIQYTSEDNSLNYISYSPSTQFGNQLSLKTSFNCSFYRNFENRLDIRNLIVNYGNLDDYENGLNPKVLNLSVEVSSYEGCDVRYDESSFCVICTNPNKLSYVDVNVNMTTSTGVHYTSFRIPIIESANSAVQLAEGVGGIFLHLDLPPEGIYDDDGNLIIDNLPVLYALGIARNNEIYNLSTMGLDTNKDLSRADTELKVMVYVDTDKTKEGILKGLYPYYINAQVNTSQADNSYKWLRFPVKVSYGKQEQIIGTYVIVNAAKPYIRIKLKSEIINLFDDCEFEIIYPSNNFSIIRNTALRLRSVNITADGENYTLRKIMKESKAEINSELFQNWVDTEIAEQSADTEKPENPTVQVVV